MLIFKKFSCIDVAKQASDFIDANPSAALSLKVRLHLMMCKNCTRFVKHLRLTKTLTSQLITNPSELTTNEEAERLLAQIKSHH